MNLTSRDIEQILKARRRVRLNWMNWLVVPIWLVWLFAIPVFGLPRLDLPLPTVLLMLLVGFAVRPVVDAGILDILDRYVNADSATLEAIAKKTGEEHVA